MEHIPAIILLSVQIYFADQPPKTQQVPMPDMQVCMKEAEDFLDHFEPPKGSIGIAAGCVKKIVGA